MRYSRIASVDDRPRASSRAASRVGLNERASEWWSPASACEFCLFSSQRTARALDVALAHAKKEKKKKRGVPLGGGYRQGAHASRKLVVRIEKWNQNGDPAPPTPWRGGVERERALPTSSSTVLYSSSSLTVPFSLLSVLLPQQWPVPKFRPDSKNAPTGHSNSPATRNRGGGISLTIK